MSISIIYIVAGDSRRESGWFFRAGLFPPGRFSVRVVFGLRARSMFFKLSYCKLPVVYI